MATKTGGGKPRRKRFKAGLKNGLATGRGSTYAINRKPVRRRKKNSKRKRPGGKGKPHKKKA